MSDNVLNRSHLFAKKQAKKAPAPALKHTVAAKNAPIVTLFPSLNAELEKLSQLVKAAEKSAAMTFSNKTSKLFKPTLQAATAGFFSRPRPTAVQNKNEHTPNDTQNSQISNSQRS